MCAIAGLLNLAGQPLPPAAAQNTREMAASMSYRGPDGEGLWQKGPVCLGHRRLSIIDLAGGAQPMLSADGKYCIVFNGEIYNFIPLRKELEKDGLVFKTTSDTEVILAAYARWGIECLDHLEGMFSFALWDMENRALFCARDRFGEKPFFWTAQNGFLAFSSELSPLLLLEKLGDFPFSFKLSPPMLVRYLAYEYVPCPHTMYAEIASLEPAHYLFAQDGKIVVEPYWEIPRPAAKAPAPRPELEKQLYDLMARSVKARMVSDVPLGVFLSGGIDSTIIAGLMATQSERPIETFSIGFTEESYDESRYARIAAAAFHTNHHERVLSATDCLNELPGIASRMDQPMADASCAPTWLLSGLARQHVTVALGGDGADEFWAGYEHYIGFWLALWYNKLPRWLGKGLIPRICAHLPESAAYINPRLAARTFLAGAQAPDWLRVQTMLTAFSPALLEKILNPEYLQNCPGGASYLAEKNLFAPTRERYFHWQPEEAAAPLARAFHVYARQFMLDDILVKVDRCSMLHSLEVRAPFLDRRVVEFAAALPVNCKLHGFKRKYLLKKAFSRLLPKEILHRNKRGFQIPVAAWLRGSLLPLMRELFDEKRLQEQGIFSPEAVAQLVREHLSGKIDRRKQLWTLLVLELWLEGTEKRLLNK